jgi:hypothetical protein
MNAFSWSRLSARMLSARAIYAAETGDMDTALDSIGMTLRLGEVMCEQPDTISYLVGMAIRGIGIGTGRTLIEYSYLTQADELDRLSSIFERSNTGDIVFCNWTDALIWDSWILAFPPESQALGDWLAMNRPMATSDVAELGLGMASYYGYKRTFIGDADRLRKRVMALKIAHAMTEPLINGIRAMREEAYDGSLLSALFILSDKTSLSYDAGLIGLEARERASLRTAATAARVAAWRAERGRLPTEEEYAAEIRSLPDPYGGKPLRYAVTETGFRVYAVGPNGIDDGGESERGDGAEKDDVGTEISFAEAGGSDGN